MEKRKFEGGKMKGEKKKVPQEKIFFRFFFFHFTQRESEACEATKQVSSNGTFQMCTFTLFLDH